MAFYLVRGNNGVIIQESYGKALKNQKYIHDSKIKKFEYLEDAEQAANDHLMVIIPYYIPIPEHIEVNEMITKARLDKANKGGKA